MKFDLVWQAVGSVPFITHSNARTLYDLILEQQLSNILELGIAHGTATCCMAAALDEMGRGTVTSVDLTSAQFSPSAEEQLASLKLDRFVDIFRMQTGYTWFLHDEIRRLSNGGSCQPKFDLCIIDGPKNWTIDGCAFFLADKLLKPGGWLIFDDLDWTYAAADSHRTSTDGITHHLLSQDERTTPQIREVFELLVVQHPSYSNFIRHESTGWAIAQKLSSPVKTYTVQYRFEDRNWINRGLMAGKRVAKRLGV
jgi:predicted O-methyltransferase YrrM